MQNEFNYNLKTPEKDFCPQEFIKLKAKGIGSLPEELYDDKSDISKEAHTIAKLYGIHLQFDRAKPPTEEKDWSYMIRLSNPGGGPINKKQWAVIDELADKYSIDPKGNASIRLTTRQAIQYHWLDKKGIIDIVRAMAKNGIKSLNASGDNLRNTTTCPLSDLSDIFDANKLSHKIASYFDLPVEPFIKVFNLDPGWVPPQKESFDYGPRLWAKTKIGIAAAHINGKTGEAIMDNCVELRINEIGIAPIVKESQVKEFQIYLGGGQGERNNAKTMACLGLPFARVSEEDLMKTLDAIAHVHKEYGDRQNRHWARLKYLVKAQGLDWYREQVETRLGTKLKDPIKTHDHGPRHLHHGWTKQANGTWAHGVFIENGRLIDSSPNGKIKTMIREIMDTFDLDLMVTPNQDILFKGIKEEDKKKFEAILAQHNYGKRNGKPYSRLRLLSGACVGLYTCPRAYTESEQFEPFLIDELEKLGWGDLAESIGITGCERQCFRPATKSIGLVGSAKNFYQLKLLGTDDGRHQGKPLIDRAENKIYLKLIPRDKVPVIIDALFKFYLENRQDQNEKLGYFNRRIGLDGLIKFFHENPETAPLMKMAAPAVFFMEME